MSQTKPHPKRPPLPAKSDGEYFPRVFHVVIPDPPKLSAVLTRRSGNGNGKNLQAEKFLKLCWDTFG